MKRGYTWVVVLALLLIASQVFGQYSRRSQFELYGGVAFPMAPEEFKEYTTVGLSGNLQYVAFPSPRIGITINVGYEAFTTDNEKFTDYLSEELTGYDASYWVDQGWLIDPSAERKSTLIRFGAGLRPYLSNPESSTQFFVLGQVNYNIITNDFSAEDLPSEYDYYADQLYVLTFDDEDWEDFVEENDEEQIGVGVGAGFELPFGSSLNLVIQGLFNIIFTEDESTTFIGATAGLVF